jgi:hypothetical protein
VAPFHLMFNSRKVVPVQLGFSAIPSCRKSRFSGPGCCRCCMTLTKQNIPFIGQQVIVAELAKFRRELLAWNGQMIPFASVRDFDLEAYLFRAAQSSFLATIGLCALASEKMTVIVEPTPLFAAWTIAASGAVGTVGVILFLRRRFLSEANDQLRRDATDAKALGEWRKFTILSLVLAMAIGLYGFALRMTGYRRTVEWSFFACAVVLLFFWRPRLSNATSPPETFLSKPQPH